MTYLYRLLTLLVLQAGLVQAVQAGWVSASDGQVPRESVVSGHEANGTTLYLCRARYKGGLHPGKLRPAFKGCNIGWGGKEVTVRQYQTYVIWQSASNGFVPPGAIVAGREQDGNKLYVCRANLNGGVHSGKVRKAFRACNIGWGGKEMKINPYEVLVR